MLRLDLSSTVANVASSGLRCDSILFEFEKCRGRRVEGFSQRFGNKKQISPTCISRFMRLSTLIVQGFELFVAGQLNSLMAELNREREEKAGFRHEVQRLQKLQLDFDEQRENRQQVNGQPGPLRARCPTFRFRPCLREIVSTFRNVIAGRAPDFDCNPIFFLPWLDLLY